MIIPDRKKAAGIIVSRLSGNGSGETKDTLTEDGDPHGDAMHSIAEDMIHAFKSGDASALVDALRAFLAEHEVSGEPDEDDSEDGY